MQSGANHFIQKPFDPDTLEQAVRQNLEIRTLKRENRNLKDQLQQKYESVGNSRIMKEIAETVDTVARSRSTVLITGESGTGKELVARAIHFRSPRREQPFIKLNCAAMPDGLIESELFGHEKGAFTGALRQSKGKFELAHGGTLLLDEIGEMPMPMQAKLLRVLQEREIDKVGAEVPIPVDVRIIATTNRDLEKHVRESKFREDLYYRLNVVPIKLPPLRERREDIPLLVDHFIAKYSTENGFLIQGIEEKALKKLTEYEWPGNIRELENNLERGVVLTKRGKISAHIFNLEHIRPGEDDRLDTASAPVGITVAEIEKRMIYKALETYNGNKTRAADVLGISIRTLRNKLKEYESGNKEEIIG
jgi:DNA-binding NtrC family response regulator